MEKMKELGKLDALGVLKYGSHARKEQTRRSDIDICIVAGTNDKKRLQLLFRTSLRMMAKYPKFDIKIFEHLPLHIKMKVIEEGKPMFARSLPELHEYFFFYRKLWQGQAVNRVGL